MGKPMGQSSEEAELRHSDTRDMKMMILAMLQELQQIKSLMGFKHEEEYNPGHMPEEDY